MSESMSNISNVHSRMLADRPSPAIPLVVMAAVPLGAIVFALLWPQEVIPSSEPILSADGTTSEFEVIGPSAFGSSLNWPGLIYWAVASAVAYYVISAIARRQGYRGGIWVNRRPLATAGLVALAVALLVILGQLVPGLSDLGLLLGRGYLPLAAMTIAIVVWGVRERRPALWLFGIAVTALALTANLYNMENMLLRLGMPTFADATDVINLAVVTLALLLGAAGFALEHAAGPRHGEKSLR